MQTACSLYMYNYNIVQLVLYMVVWVGYMHLLYVLIYIIPNIPQIHLLAYIIYLRHPPGMRLHVVQLYYTPI